MFSRTDGDERAEEGRVGASTDEGGDAGWREGVRGNT